MTNDGVLSIAEIPYETGQLRFRFARHLSEDGTRWVRHGWFTEFHPNGAVASEGEFVNDVESGLWREYYENGQLSSEGEYREGREHGVWRFWDEEGRREPDVIYFFGNPVRQ